MDEGAFSVDVADALAGTQDETPVYGEPGEEREVAFGLSRVIALFEAGADVDVALGNAARKAGLSGAPESRKYAVPEQDWVRLTQSQFDPIRISPRLWIVPSWHSAPDPAAINIVLDPGLAFGTGSHPTTRLCLDWLDTHLAPGSSVIDYGCGSGILSIAAAKLGASTVIGIDIDEQAVTASRANARANGVDAQFHNAASCMPVAADIVLANILSNPLKVLAPALSGLVRSGGAIVLSGILAPQADEVAEAYLQWFDMVPPVAEDGWVRLTGVRKA